MPRSRAGSSRCRRRSHSSNVMLLDPKTGEPTRDAARASTTDGTKERVGVKSGEADPAHALSED